MLFGTDSSVGELNSKIFKYKDIEYGDITIPDSGYVNYSSTPVGSPSNQIDGTILFATIVAWGVNNGHCFNVNTTYIIGDSGVTITNLIVRFFIDKNIMVFSYFQP